MGPIQKLSESLITKIAAGEVVERPASVVKELVENSIDAGASRVEVRIGGGGLTSISVTDNGSGIPTDEIRLALERHATSKIANTEDLSRIETLGFRGEALPSIAGISHFDLLTRPADSESGTHLHAKGGEIRTMEPHGAPTGTTISVSHLFFNTPARRKFMRSKATEFGHIERTLRKIALAHPDLDLSLEHEGKPILQLSKATNLLERVSQLYGKEISTHLITVEGKEGPYSLCGVISDSKIAFGRAQELWFLANDRPIQDRMLQRAVMEGYRTLLMERRYPLAVLSLEIPPHLIDVNVHPTKAEIRLADPQAIFRLVSKSIADVHRAGDVDHVDGSEQGARDGSLLAQSSFALSDSISHSFARTDSEPYAAEETSTPRGFFSSLKYLSTLDQTYLLLQGADALYVVDQHAAHERVLFEELRTSQSATTPPSQNLLLPISLELSSGREAALKPLLPFLTQIGFEIEAFGDRTLLIRSVPAPLGTTDPRSLFIDLADAAIGAEGKGPLQDRADEVLSRVACHAAVRAHDSLTPSEIEHLLRQMDQTDLSTNCPHGRPTFLQFSLGDLEKLFHRK